MNDLELQKVAKLIQSANHVAVLTGAGISAESGMATFRDPLTGMWAHFRPEDLATPDAFRRNPAVVWNWYMQRRQSAIKALPNPGHRVLAWLETKVPRLSLITQNVDNLHQSAGSSNVVELHGSIHRFKCFENHHAIPIELADASPEEPPQCPSCKSLARPDVVWFGEMLPELAMNRAIGSAQTADLFLVIGTSGVVQPAASLGITAKRNGSKVVVINPDPNAAMAGEIFLQGPSGVVLPRLAEAAWGVDQSFF